MKDLKDLKKGQTFWVMISEGYRFDPKDQVRSDAVWTDKQVQEFCKNEVHPRRFVKVKVIKSKGNWKKHTEDL